MKKLLILTSMRTGGGHVSLTEAIDEAFKGMEGVQTRVVDGFDLMSPTMRWLLADSYGLITRRSWLLWLWRLGYRTVEAHPGLSVRVFETVCCRRFLALAANFQPDGILAVNPCFCSSVINIMEKKGRRVPLMCLQADLINIPSTWFDKRTALNFALTQEAYDYSLRKGMSPQRMAMLGFPVRKRFYATEQERAKPLPRYPRRILLMGGAEGAGNFVGAAHALLAATECQLTIVCGRNKKLKTHLEKTLLPHDGARARVLGFVSNMREEMAQADLIVMRGSPNSAMEAAAMNKPLIITDSLPGQEADNPKVLAKHGLCILQPDPDALPETIRTLFDPANPTLKSMREAQRAYMDPACASRIAQRIADSIGRQPRDRSGAVVRS